MHFFAYTLTSEKKKNSIAKFSNSSCSRGVKKQGRAANRPFSLQVKQPPREDKNIIRKRARLNIQYS